jgi:hypothetical protein
MNQPARRLNHVETVYRPGEREIAVAALELLGCRVTELQGFLFAVIDPATGNGIDNAIYSSQVTEEQWNFEHALTQAINTDEKLSDAATKYREQMSTHPQYVFHIGIAFDTREAWEEAVTRVSVASSDHPDLAGRITVAGAFRPGDPGSMSDQCQAFIHTDVFSSGLLTLGQQIELQYTPASVYEQTAQLTGAEPTA